MFLYKKNKIYRVITAAKLENIFLSISELSIRKIVSLFTLSLKQEDEANFPPP